MRLFSSLLILSLLGYGTYWVNDKNPYLKEGASFIKESAFQLIQTRTVPLVECPFTPSQIMEKHHLTRGRENIHTPCTTVYHPYLLIEAKFASQEGKTEESTILWDLVEGEMVLNTRQWTKTHGFADCMNVHADRSEYLILKTILRNRGKIEKGLLESLIERDERGGIRGIEQACKKKLILQEGNTYRIHIKNPVMYVKPKTSFDTSLVTQNRKKQECIPARYSTRQVIHAAESLFGQDFAIRRAETVFLPVHFIQLEAADGSHHTTKWNGLNGERL